MSTALETGFVEQSVDDCLVKIDATAKATNKPPDRNLQLGLFGVISFDQKADDSVSREAPLVDGGGSPPVQSDADQLSPSESLNKLNENLDWSDLFGMDIFTDEQLSSFYLNDSLPITYQGQCPYALEPYPLQLSWSQQNVNISENLTDSGMRPEFSLDIPPEDAQMLLKLFQDRTVAHMSSFPSSAKGPLYTVNLAAAIQTLAHTTYMQSPGVTHASFCNMLGLLALAARSLATASAGQSDTKARWFRISGELHERSKNHLRWSLQTELQGPNKAKYKDQLMAIKALLGYSVSSLADYALSYSELARQRNLQPIALVNALIILHCFVIQHK